MKTDVPKPDISPNFTIEDIHKIREWQHKRRKGMTSVEICDDINKGAAEFDALLSQPIDPAIMAEVERRLASVEKEIPKKTPIKV